MVDKEKFLSFINDKRYGGMSENEFLSNGINFSYGQNIDIYSNPKGITTSKDFTVTDKAAGILDAHPLGLTQTLTPPITFWGGTKFTTVKAVRLGTVVLTAGNTATHARLLTSAGVVLQVVVVTALTATFNYDLASGVTYRVEVNSQTPGLVCKSSVALYPYNKTNINYIFGSANGIDYGGMYAIESITTAETLVTSGNIMKILRLPNNIQSNAYFCDDGTIYIDSGSGPALVYTVLIADKKILNACTFGNYVIFFTSAAFHKITFTGNDFKTFASCTESVGAFTASYLGFTTANSTDLPVYNYEDSILYRGAGNKLFSTPNTFISVSVPLTLPIGDKIVGLSFLNSNLKIYVNHYNTNSKLLFWNETSSDKILYKNKVFKAVTTDGQLDYVVCSDGLYIFSGYQGVKVYDNDFSTFGTSGAVNCVPSNLIGLDTYTWYVAHEHKLYRFGKKYTSLKNGIIVDKIFTDHITAMLEDIVYAGTVYLATDAKKIYSKSSTYYNYSGYVETVVFYGDTMEKRKRLKKIFNAYSMLQAESIEFYFSIDGAAYPSSPQFTISDYANKWKEYFQAELTGLTNHWIKVKIVINGLVATTPTLYESDIFEEFVENK